MCYKTVLILILHGYAVTLAHTATAKGAFVGTEVEPSFAEPIPNITVAAGRSVTLPCVVDDIQNYKVAWIHTDRHTLLTLHDRVITRNHRYSISHNSYRTWWLHISDVEEADRGEFMCQINTSPMKSQVGYLNVVVPPRIDETVTSSDTDVREGGDVSLRCRASGSPTPKITWRREDQKGIPEEGLKFGSSGVEGEFLNISKVSRLHMGAYLCIASNGVQPSVSKRIMLNVNFAPMIWIPNQLVGASLDTDIVLDCSLESHPKSVTYWMKDGGIMILSNAKYDSVLENFGLYKARMELRIRSLSPTDYGSYTCVAKNSLGETEGRIKLYEIPRPTTLSSTSHYSSKGSKTEASRKADYSTEIGDKESSAGAAASAVDHGFRKQGTEREEILNTESSGCPCFESHLRHFMLLVITVRMINDAM